MKRGIAHEQNEVAACVLTVIKKRYYSFAFKSSAHADARLCAPPPPLSVASR